MLDTVWTPQAAPNPPHSVPEHQSMWHCTVNCRASLLFFSVSSDSHLPGRYYTCTHVEILQNRSRQHRAHMCSTTIEEEQTRARSGQSAVGKRGSRHRSDRFLPKMGHWAIIGPLLGLMSKMGHTCWNCHLYQRYAMLGLPLIYNGTLVINIDEGKHIT